MTTARSVDFFQRGGGCQISTSPGTNEHMGSYLLRARYGQGHKPGIPLQEGEALKIPISSPSCQELQGWLIASNTSPAEC